MFESDKDGFLVGKPIGGSGAERSLRAIKSDTASILSLMRQSVRVGALARATVTPAARGRAAAGLVRGSGGRFVAGGDAGAGGVANQRMAEVAAASTAMARTAEQQRRQDKADKQARGADGRFGAGGRDGRGGMGGRLSALGRGAAAALDGGERIDPLLGAMGELRAVGRAGKNVVTPVGRALGGMFGRGGEKSPEVGWLRRMWRELRGMRKESAAGDRATARALKDVGGGGGEGGGGILGLIMGFLSGPLLAVAGVAFAAIAGWFTGGALYKWFESLNLGEKFSEAWNTATAYITEKWDTAVKFVSETFEPARKLFSDIGTWVSNLPGMPKLKEGLSKAADAAKEMLPKAAEAIKGGVTAAVETAANAGKKAIGWVSKQFESGKGGAGTVSTGKGDAGGASYGTHQLASKTGTLQRFLTSSGYGAQFAGMEPGSPEFNAKWKSLAASDPGFGTAQHDFIQKTHYDPQMARLKKAGIDLSGRGDAVKEAVFSTATQYGGNTNVIQKALAGRNASSMSDADIISAVQDYKAANNESLMRRNDPGVRAGVLKRVQAEKLSLLSLNAAGAPGLPASVAGSGSPSLATMPRLPAGPSPVVVPPVPAVESAGSTRLSSASPAPSAPAAPVGQDVRDRSIALIVTGGIGGATAHR